MTGRLRLIVLVILTVIVLVSLSFNADPDRVSSWPEKALLEVVGQMQTGLISSARTIEQIWREYFYLVDLVEENQRLRQELGRARGQVNSLKEAAVANDRLRKLLNFSDSYKLPYIGAQVVAWEPTSWYKIMTINRGGDHGVRPGMPVVSNEGLVGRILETSPRFSKVLLVVDENSSVDAFVQRNRVRGLLAGCMETNCFFRLKYVLKKEDVVPGDELVTSGLDGELPRGIPLGTVTRVKAAGQDIFLEVEVQPTVDFNQLEEVLVVLSESSKVQGGN